MKTVLIKYAETWEDVSHLVERDSFTRTQKLHTDLSPTINSLKFQILRDTSVMNAVLNASSVHVKVTEDGAAYFTGILKKSLKNTVSGTTVTLEVEATDYAYLLKEEILTQQIYNNYQVCNPADPDHSILHSLIALTEYSASYLAGIQTIAVSLEYVIIDSGGTVEEALIDLLGSYGYLYNVEPDGSLKLYPYAPDSITPAYFLTNANINGKLIKQKIESQASSITVSWRPIYFEASRIVFSDPSGSTSVNKCNIQIAPEEYYPADSDTKDTKWNYEYNSYEVLKVENAAADINKDSQVSLVSFASFDTYAIGSFYNENSVLPKYITKLDVKGDVYYRKTDYNYNTVDNGEPTENTEEVEAPYILEESYAAALAQKRANYWKYADFKYTLTSRVKIPIGEYISLTDTVMEVSTNAQVIEIKDKGGEDFIEYSLVGSSEYQILPDSSAELNYTPPPAVQDSPVSVDGLVTEEILYTREVKTGISSETTTIPEVPLMSEAVSHFQAIEVSWSKQMNLSGFKEYHLQVSSDGILWYPPGMDGTAWNGGSEGEYLVLSYPRLVHIPISSDGTEEDPTPRVLQYRVRQTTAGGLTSAWSDPVTGQTSLLQTSDIPAGSVTANKVSTTLLTALVANINDKLIIDDSNGWAATGIDTRAYMNENKIVIQKKGESETWEDMAALSHDDELSGQILLGDNIQIKTGSPLAPSATGNWNLLTAPYSPYNVAYGSYMTGGGEFNLTFIAWPKSYGYEIAPLYSQDGQTWTESGSLVYGGSNCIILYGTVWYSVNAAHSYKSTDYGATWTEITAPSVTGIDNYGYFSYVAEFAGKYFMKNLRGYLETADFQTFTQVEPLELQTTRQLITLNNRLVMVHAGSANGNQISYSTDGINWYFNDAPAGFYGVTYTDLGLYFAVEPAITTSDHSSLWSSPDLVNWTLVMDSPDYLNYYYSIRTFGRWTFVLGEFSRGQINPDVFSILYTDDYGETWKESTIPLGAGSIENSAHDRYRLDQIIQVGSTFCLVTALYSSPDWTWKVWTSEAEVMNWTERYSQDSAVRLFSGNGLVHGVSIDGAGDFRIAAGTSDRTADLHFNTTGGKIYINGEDIDTIGVAISESTLISHQIDTLSRTIRGSTWTDGWITDYFYLPALAVVEMDFTISYRSFSAVSSWGGLDVKVWIERNDSGTWESLGSTGYNTQEEMDSYGTVRNTIIHDRTAEPSSERARYKFSYRAPYGSAEINMDNAEEATSSDETERFGKSYIIVKSLTGVTGPRGFSGLQGTKGDKGDQGEMGPVGLSAVPWNETETFPADQAVIYAGAIYIATSENSGMIPPDYPLIWEPYERGITQAEGDERYYTKSQVDTKLSDYDTSAEVDSKIAAGDVAKWDGSSKYVSSEDPDDLTGSDGDFWFKYEV